jgi:hypothetical protein
MHDESLLQDLREVHASEAQINMLRQADVVTYSRLFALLGDTAVHPEYRAVLCRTLQLVAQCVDKRRAVGPLLDALRSDETELHCAAAYACGTMGLKRAIPRLGELASDKNQPFQTRICALQALGSMADPRAISALWSIVDDAAEPPELRSSALEQTASCVEDNSIARYIRLLGDTSPDLRFWSAYCLSQACHTADISPALPDLDRVVASDHALPDCWGWHVDREALRPFEFIYFRALSGDSEACPANTWIVSPAAEFETFVERHRRWSNTWEYATDLLPPVAFRIDPAWLMAQFGPPRPSAAVARRPPQTPA